MAQKVQGLDDDPVAVRRMLAGFPSGVAVLAVERDGRRHAFVASSFMVGVSLRPCLVAVAVERSSTTWRHVEGAGAIGVSILGRGQGEVARRLAGADRALRFTQVPADVDESGAVFIEGAAMWLRCSVHAVTGAGDHWMALLEVGEAGGTGNEPLVWHGARFRELAEDVGVDVTGVPDASRA